MTNSIKEVYIVDALRTPIGKAGRAFRHSRPDDLLATIIAALMQKNAGIPPNEIDDVIIGCAMPEAEQGMNVARISLLLAGLPNTVPGMTINRFCSSGLQTISLAVDRIAQGEADIIIAGGTESMTLVPMGGNKFVANPNYFTNNEKHVDIAYGMGLTAEFVAQKYNITREEQDAFALESHHRALAASEKGLFKEEIYPITVTHSMPDLHKGEIINVAFKVTKDEGPREGSNMEMLAKLPAVFKNKGTVTAANSSQMSDGAGVVLCVSEQALKRYNLKPMARLLSYSVAGVPPKYMGIGPTAAIPLALEKANLGIEKIDWIELNEAFAAQSLAVMKELHLDHAKTNPHGGAIALGHPLGATGAVRTATLLHGMRQQNLKYGMVTMCIGTGMGAAGIFEYLH